MSTDNNHVSNEEDRLVNVSFEEQIPNPKYIKPLRMLFERVGRFYQLIHIIFF